MIKVVIGANFGDEGKGLMTDYFVSQFRGWCLNVRFNGGAQAGHTVVTPEGRRHKFSHFGAGGFFNSPTYLSRFFIANPLLFAAEVKEIRELNLNPMVYLDEESLISTPYDMYINQVTEVLRGEQRHGSCGVGINETIERSECESFCLKAKDLRKKSVWKAKLWMIAREYFPMRLQQLGDCPNPNFDYDMFESVFARFVEQVTICDNGIFKGRDLVFEGAQGLLLDQNSPYFPHVTRSNTGIENVGVLLREANQDGEDVEVVYVTRCYLTRHGRGPLPGETKELPYPDIVDKTNQFNEFQEHLRFGVL